MDGSQGKHRVDYLTALCRVVPYHIVEAVLRDPSPAALAPERFDGSLLFSDVVGFTPMCERLAAEGAQGLSRLEAILSTLFEHLLEEALFPFGGYVVHFGGDSITTVFRGPDHVVRAAAAALRAQQFMHEQIADLAEAHGERLLLRVGLSCGDISVPIVGDATRGVAGCAGPVAHAALRMQHLALPGEVAVHSSARERLEGAAMCRRAGGDHWVLTGLLRYPPPQRIAELADRVLARVEEKIALLEPLLAEPLRARLMSVPAEWGIEGELRCPVIVFCEVWGLDDTEEAAGPRLREAVNLAQSLFRTYRKYGGVILKADLAARGHRLLIVFGLHRPSEHDAERALLAALEASARVHALTASTGSDVGVRTGMHVGSAYFGAIGSTHKHDITLIGDSVNTAARVCSAAACCEVLATKELFAPYAAEFDHHERPPLLVKGKAEPLELFAVAGRARGHSDYVRASIRQKPLGGRDDSIETLRGIVDSAFSTEGRVVGICGDRGMGKSSMLRQALNLAADRGATGIVGYCRYATRSVPLGPVASMFSTFFGLTSGDDERDRDERARAGLAPYRLAGGAEELVHLLQAVWSRDDRVCDFTFTADERARSRALDSIVEFVSKRLEQEPLLYALEDVHHADSLTRELVVRLADLTRTGRFLFVVSYRPEPELDLLRERLTDELVLGPLGREQLEQLLCLELGATAVDSGLLEFAWQRTGGHPCHGVEFARFLRERSLVRLRAGVAIPLDRGLGALDLVVPHTLTQLTLARLDELGSVERRVLRVASAIGRRFDRAILEQTVEEELPAEVVAEAVGALRSHGVLSGAVHGAGEVEFRDGLTREVAYGTIPEAERRRLHQRIADAITPLAIDGDVSPAVVALHRERAGQHREAAVWFERAVTVALRSEMLREVLGLVDGWAGAIEHLPEPEQPEEDVRARMILARLLASARRGMAVQALRVAEQLQPLLCELEAADRRLAELWTANAMGDRGEHRQAIARLARLFEDAGECIEQAEVAWHLARLELAEGDVSRAELWCAKGLALARAEPYLLRAQLELTKAEIALAVGEVGTALQSAQRIRVHARASGARTLGDDATRTLGRARLAAGELDQARRSLREALDGAVASGRSAEEAALWVEIGQCFVWEGALDAARRPLERGLALARAIGAEACALLGCALLTAVEATTVDPGKGQEAFDAAALAAERAHSPEVRSSARLLALRVALLAAGSDALRVRVAAIESPEAVMPWPLHQRERERLVAEATRPAEQRSRPA